MIYGAALSPMLKKAYKNKAVQVNVKTLIERLPLDPDTSNMDACVLSPQDVGGFMGKNLIEALKKKHPRVAVIYICRSEKEAKILDDLDFVNVFTQSKYTPETLEECVNKVLEGTDIAQRNVVITSKDQLSGSVEVEPKAPTAPIDDIVSFSAKAEPSVELEPEPMPEELTELPMPEPEPEVVETAEKELSTEDKIKQYQESVDWDFFQKCFNKDHLIRELMNENTQYAGAVNMMNVIDRQIAGIFKDPTFSTSDKLDKIRELGVDRTGYKATANSILKDKLSSVITTITTVATTYMDKQISDIRKSMNSVAKFQTAFKQTEKIRMLTSDRIKLSKEIAESLANLIATYRVMDASVDDFIASMQEGKPSENDYINSLFKDCSKLFVPQNAGMLTTKICEDLQANLVPFSGIETQLQALMESIFKLCDADTLLIDHQQKMIDLLSAQRVEDVVIVNEVIKSSMRIFIGANDVGTTATALTYAGMLARRNNTILIDLRPESKFEEYGQDYMEMNEFLADRIELPFICIHGNYDTDLEALTELTRELSERLNYYRHVIVILDNSQAEVLKKLAESALSVTFVSNATPRSIALTKAVTSEFKVENVARLAAIIDCPIDPLEMEDELGLDAFTCKAAGIPYLPEIRVCAIKHNLPYKIDSVVAVFEEAFR